VDPGVAGSNPVSHPYNRGESLAKVLLIEEKIYRLFHFSQFMETTNVGIVKRWGSFGDRLINWYQSETSKKKKIVKTLIMIILLMIIMETNVAFMGLIMLTLPRLMALITITCIAVPLAILLFTPFVCIMEAISDKMAIRIWTVGAAMAFILLIIGGGLFWFGGKGTTRIPLLVRKMFFGSETRFPLAWLEDIAIDSNGKIYTALTSYNRIQVYDNKGMFVRGWFVEADGGAFYIWTEDDNIHMLAAPTKRHDIFGQTGKLINSELVTSVEDRIEIYEREMSQNDDYMGNSYSIENGMWFPKIIRTDSVGNQSIVVTDPFYFRLLSRPYPALLLTAVGLFIATTLGIIVKIKIRKRV
jgi:hypothetical protein